MKADPGKVGDGSVGEIKVDHNDDSAQQAAYALFSANNDAICVAYVSITWPSGDEYAWVGDWGQTCGGSWYFSNVFIKGSNYKPNCLWIDANGDQPQTGFQVHFPEFVTQEAGVVPSDKDENYYCNKGPPFKLYTNDDPNVVTYWVLNNKSRRSIALTSPQRGPKTSHRRRFHQRAYLNGTQNTLNSTQLVPADRHAGQLIVDNSTDHSTSDLCKSETSVGPDYANVADGNFCKMADKSLWPICTNKLTDECFNLDMEELIVGGKATRDTSYHRVTTWGSSNDHAAR